MVRIAKPARVFFCIHASGGHSVRIRIYSDRVDVTTATAASFYLTFADDSVDTWVCTLIADTESATFVQGVTASSVYAEYFLVTGDLVANQIGDALLETVVTVAGQPTACDARVLTVTA